ncbi:hypothetical protein D9619_011601 [Psilocybe cf. subviscida]|uniref:Wax synthase domain-containing protein n=1 Tax=Psilocybe cf. subviscida TaxID=2480587 RepID=A0A8H5BTG8_9AGAR|nr:hypothetical protein D9619_011601 [Psilocybe cf. subviscida]
MRGKTDTNAGLVPLLNLLLIVAWAQGGRDYARVNWLFFLPIASLCVYIIFFTATSDITSDYASALNVAQLFFVASATILLRHHQPELRQIGQNKVTAEMSFYERLKWAVSLLLTPRGVGWSFEPTDHLPPKPNSSRLRFIFTQLKWIAFYALMFDVVSMFIRANPCFGTGGPSLAAFGWVWRSTSWLYILVAYAPMSLLYASLSIASVGLGFSKPHHWPHLFGTPRDAYTLRNCWGRVWHQMLRKLLTVHSNVAATTLDLPRNTFTTYFKLCLSFFISGLIHYAGDYMLYQNWSGRSMEFFLLQAVGITLEDAVVGIAKTLGYTTKTPLTKLLGFCWVFAWFTFCLPLWLDPNLHAGTGDQGVNLSIILGIWKGDWTPKRAPVTV